MKNQTQEALGAGPPPALERIPAAAKRMGVSVSQCYRELKSGRLSPLVKLGERASAVPSSSVTNWINSRISEATKASGVQWKP